MKIVVGVRGMMCGMCEAHVASALRQAFPDAKKVKASRGKGCAQLELNREVTEDELRAALEPTGYEVTGVKCS